MLLPRLNHYMFPEVQKYYYPAHDQHLRKRHSRPWDDSCVKVLFETPWENILCTLTSINSVYGLFFAYQ